MAVVCSKVDLNDPKNAEDTLFLLNTYAMDPMGGGEAITEYTREHLIAELVKRPTAHVFIARVDDQPAGLSICFEGFSTFACKPLINIHDFCVSPHFRRRGVGTVLMNTIEEYARSIGCCKITLEVLEGNHVAKALYQSVGFEGYELDPAAGKAIFWQKKLY
jgi:ribosomal protein S18 acetylase RimI-like enzyme